MIWVRLALNVILALIITWQAFVIGRLRRENSKLRVKQLEQFVQSAETVMNLTRALRAQDVQHNFDPQVSMVSKSTQDLMSKMWSDPVFPRASYMPIIKPPATTFQPPRSSCVNCGRPIMSRGGTRWIDHAGRSECDGAITGVRGDHAPKEDV